MSDNGNSFNDAPIKGMDWLIQNMIKVAEAGPGLSVVLSTAGGTVSGNIISGSEYVRLLKKDLGRIDDEDLRDDLVEWAASLAHVFKEYDGPGPYFIHLTNVRMDIGGSMRLMPGPWRGNLAHVTGITLASLT